MGQKFRDPGISFCCLASIRQTVAVAQLVSARLPAPRSPGNWNASRHGNGGHVLGLRRTALKNDATDRR